MGGPFARLPAGVEAELFVRKVRRTAVRFANSEFEGTQETVHESRTVRVISEGRMGMASSTKPGDDDELLLAAVETARYGPAVGYSFPGQSAFAPLELVSGETGAAPLGLMVDVAADLAAALQGRDPRIRVTAGVEREQIEVSLKNNNGFSGSYAKTVWTAGLGGRLIQGDDMLYHAETLTRIDPHADYAALKDGVRRIFEQAAHVVPFGPGVYPVIFAPSQVALLLEPFIASLNGKAFARGISPLRERMGQPLLDPRVTIVDDGTLPWTVSSAPFDREGVPTRRNVLVEAGVPKQLLLDLQTAGELGMAPSGNGAAGGPAPHRVLLFPGGTPLAELVGQIDRGLIVYNSMGAWAGNPYSGNIAGTISLGLRIDGGAVSGRVKNCMFSVNAFRHFHELLLGISREVMLDQRSATLPYVMLGDVVVSSDEGKGPRAAG